MTTRPHRTAEESGARRLRGVRRGGIIVVALCLAGMLLPVGQASADVTFNQRMLQLVNAERTANGLPLLVSEPTLSANAEDAPYAGCGFPVSGRAKDMGDRNYFSHTILGCATQSVFDILVTTGLVYSGAGENVAWMNGTTDPLVAAENLHNQMMNSSGHRANILSPNFTKIGIGSWRTSPNQSWTGGGYPLINVFIGVQIFAGGPVTATSTTSTPPTTAPTTVPATTVPPVPPTAVPAGPVGRFTPLTPARILDTRDGTGAATGPVPPGATVDVQVAGRGGLPANDVSAVAMTVTVTQPSAEGYLTLFPAGTSRPLAANLNFAPGETVSNLVVVKVGANGKVSLFNPAGTTHVVADVAGWYSLSGSGNAGRFEPVAASRIVDTRTGVGGAVRLGPGASLDMQVSGRGGIPASGVQAVVMNVSVTATSAAGFLTAYPAGEARPWASNLAFGPGSTVSSRAMVKLGAGGRVTIFNGGGSADVILDVTGWYTDASVAGTDGALTPLIPARIVDTRDGLGGVRGPLASSATVEVQVSGRGGVPSSGARAVVLNATVTQAAGAGHLTIFPSGTARPPSSDLNFGAGETQANLVVAELGADGKISVYAAAGTHVVFDVAGWIS